MRQWVLLLLLTGCTHAYRLPPSASSLVGGNAGGGSTVVAVTTPPADVEATDDSRFAAKDVSSPPPPKPTRQIDRSEAQKQPEAREVDKTLAQTSDSAHDNPPVTPVHTEGLLIYSAHVTMAVYQVAPALDAIELLARTLGGYLASRNDTQIEIRVPRARFDEALQKVEASGDVVHREVAAQDVTDAYTDIEARLKNARAVRDRLQALLEKAAVKEAIEIQRELERVTGDIEVLEGKLKLLQNRIAYSTIDVAFEARGVASLHDTPAKLPFPWLSELGLPGLLEFSGTP